MLRMIERITLGALVLMALSTSALAQSNLTAKANSLEPRRSSTVVESDRTRDGLVGPVRRVRTEIAKLLNESGRLVESKHAVLEIVAYDIKGTKVENQYFPVAGANLTGKEVYKYDDKGNISEMTLVNDDGSLLSKETYKYEFDFAGNWNRMTTSVAVIEAGRMSFEPTEITYRSIMYYLDEKMMRMAQPVAPPASSSPASNTIVTSDSRVQPLSSKPTVNNSSTSNPKASVLPTSTVTPDKLNLGSTELPNARSSVGVQSSIIQIDSEPPPPPAPRPILKPVSGGVLNGTAIDLPSPIYPLSAKRYRISGVVVVEVVVDETGKVISASASSGPIQLREVAVQAALRARFSPTKLSGQPVKVSGVINYRFSLTQ
jgi:TonB family protein